MKRKAMLTHYFKAITDVARQGDAREESFYSCLEALLQQCAASSGRDEVHVTTLPKKTEAGNPDFRGWNGQDRVIGYIEAKKPSTSSIALARCCTPRPIATSTAIAPGASSRHTL